MPLPRWACILQSSPNAPMGQASQITKSHGTLGFRVKNFEGFKILENVSHKDAYRFLELLNVFEHANLKKQKQRLDTMKRSIDFLMSLSTNNQRSPQVSFQSIVQCILHYYILITIYFCICAFTSHHLWLFVFVFLHFHHHLLLHLCFYIFITLYLLHLCFCIFIRTLYLFAFLHFH